MPRYRKTRRGLKGRKDRRTRRLRRRQRGGAELTVPEKWVDKALYVFQTKLDNTISTLGDLIDNDLNLSSSIYDGLSNAKLTYQQGPQGTVRINEEMSELATHIHAIQVSIIGNDNLNTVSPDEFKEAIGLFPTDKDRDDTVPNSLDYLLFCENALRSKASMELLTPEGDPINAFKNSQDILFIWALAVNNVDDPNMPSLIDPEVMKENLSE